MREFENNELSAEMKEAMDFIHAQTIGALNTFDIQTVDVDADDCGTPLCYGVYAVLQALVDFPAHKSAKDMDDWESFLEEAMQWLIASQRNHIAPY